MEYQLWICKTSIWVMMGFFPTHALALARYNELAGSSITDFRIVKAHTGDAT